MAASTSPGIERRSHPLFTPALAGVVAVSALVLAACVLASFRLGFADDLPTLLRVNGPRVLLGAAAGASSRSSGALRLGEGRVRALAELELFALAAGAAGGGFFLASGSGGAAAAALFAVGSVAGGGLAFALARGLDRPRRAANLGAAVLLAVLLGVARSPGPTLARDRTASRPRCSGRSAISAGRGPLRRPRCSRAPRSSARSRCGVLGTVAGLALAAYGLAAGAVGPLAFVGTFVPRAVRALGRADGFRCVSLRVGGGGRRSRRRGGRGPAPSRRRLRLPVERLGGAPRDPALPRLEPRAAAPRGRHAGLAEAFEIAELALIADVTAGSRALVAILARVIATRDLGRCGRRRRGGAPRARRGAAWFPRSTRVASPNQSLRPA